MPPPLPQYLRPWDGFKTLSVSWWLGTSPVIGLTCWKDFYFLPGRFFAEVHHFVALPQPHSEIWTRILPYYSLDYVTWQVRCYYLPRTYYCLEICNWVLLYVLHGVLRGFPPPEINPQICLIMRWGKQGNITHQLPHILEKLYPPILPYSTNVRMHINPPSFLGLWPQLHPLVIPLCLLSSYTFLPHICPPSCLPTQFWMVNCLNLIAGLEFDICGLLSSSFPPWYPCWLYTPCYFSSLGLWLVAKRAILMMLWVIPWIFVVPSPTAWTAIKIFHWQRVFSQLLLWTYLFARTVTKMVLNYNPSQRTWDTVTGCPFTIKGVL